VPGVRRWQVAGHGTVLAARPEANVVTPSQDVWVDLDGTQWVPGRFEAVLRFLGEGEATGRARLVYPVSDDAGDEIVIEYDITNGDLVPTDRGALLRISGLAVVSERKGGSVLASGEFEGTGELTGGTRVPDGVVIDDLIYDLLVSCP
jgi:hypothetical protein